MKQLLHKANARAKHMTPLSLARMQFQGACWGEVGRVEWAGDGDAAD